MAQSAKHATEPEANSNRASVGLSLAGRARPWAVGIVLGLAIVVVYGRALPAPMIFDDVASVIHNSSIVSLWPPVGSPDKPGPFRPPTSTPVAGRPLVNLSFAINYHFGGLNPVGFRVFNIWLHVLSALLLLAIVRRTLRLHRFGNEFANSANVVAFAVAAVWALHPLQTEAVVYITQRTELMMAFFYLATLYCSLRYWECKSLPGEADGSVLAEARMLGGRRIWPLLAVICCLCGMASKEVMVSAPLIVLLFERTFVTKSLKRAVRGSWPLHVGLLATWGLLLALNYDAPRSDSAGFGLEVSAYDWWLTQTQVLITYLKLLAWPSPLLIHYDWPYLTSLAGAWMYAIPVFVLLAVTLVLVWRNWPVGFLGAWFFVILAPTSLVPIVTEIAAERRMYLPLAAPAVFVVIGSYRLLVLIARHWGMGCAAPYDRLLRVVVATLVLVGGILGWLSAKRLGAYHDETILWREVLQYQPNNQAALNGLGLKLSDAGRLGEAIEMLQKVAAMNPDSPSAANNLALALVKGGRSAEAIDVLKTNLARHPDSPLALNTLGIALVRLGRVDEGVNRYREAIRLLPDYDEARINLGSALVESGQVEQGLDELRDVIRAKPDNLEAGMALGTSLMRAGRASDAATAFEDTIARWPDDPVAHNNLAAALMQLQRFPEATTHIQHALRVKPDYAEAHYNLGLALLNSGDSARAIEQFEESLKLTPDLFNAHNRLAGLYADDGDVDKAIEHYKAAIRLNPDSLNLRMRVGQFLRQAGRPEKAIEHYRAALKLRPEFVELWGLLARTLAEANRSDEAIAAAKQGISAARDAEKDAAAGELEDWLHHYRNELRREGEATAPTEQAR